MCVHVCMWEQSKKWLIFQQQAILTYLASYPGDVFLHELKRNMLQIQLMLYFCDHFISACIYTHTKLYNALE